MAVKAISVAEAVSMVGIKALVYGPTGAGKTTLARTMPAPTLVLDFEGGVISLLGAEGIAVCPIKSTDDLLQIVKELQGDTTFRSVVFDGLSLFVKRRVQELRGAKERVTWDEWQRLTNEIRAAVLPLLQIRKHLLLTCLPRWIREKDERGRDVGPIIGATVDLTPALRQDLIAACDLVGYLVAPNDPLFPNESERKVIFQPTNSVVLTCKSRASSLTVVSPDFTAWLDALSIPQTDISVSVTVSGVSSAEFARPVELSEIETTEQQQAEEQTPELDTQPQAEQENDEITKQIFRVARELGLDNKALGRIAKNYFGTSFVKNLNQDQKQRLLAFLERRLSERKSGDAKADTAVSEFIRAWRQARGDSSEIPFEVQFAQIAVRNNWLPDELEAAISEKLLERSFDFGTLPEDRYWLSAIPEDLLSEIVAELRR